MAEIVSHTEGNTNDVVAHFFRHEYGKTVSYLTRKFGATHIERIEDAVQEALIKAMNTWGYQSTPQNPSSWILRVAANYMIDLLRRDKKVSFQDATVLTDAREGVLSSTHTQQITLDTELKDDQLRMIFACCHPALPVESQIMLTLKLLCGFGNAEIADALLKKEDAVAKALTRARKKFKDEIGSLDVPVEMGLRSRLLIVLKIIYLLFNEGYSPNYGEELIKKDLCMEAIRLGEMLLENDYCKQPEVHALVALMYLHTARFDARVDAKGALVTLEQQDRSCWDQELIAQGAYHLDKAMQPGAFSDYHIQAGIAYTHAIATSFADTDWTHILELYDLQLRHIYSPIVALNRIVAYSRVHGAKKAYSEIKKLDKEKLLETKHLYYAIKAEILSELEAYGKAKVSLEKALNLTQNQVEKKHLQKQLETVEKNIT